MIDFKKIITDNMPFPFVLAGIGCCRKNKKHNNLHPSALRLSHIDGIYKKIGTNRWASFLLSQTRTQNI